MKAFSIIVAFFVIACTASAQKVYFTYLQADNNLPFYVKLNGKTYSSSGSYLILSHLRDSSYTFVIGYPGKSSELKFNVAINGKDRGFLLKNFDGGPGLFDMQTSAVIKPVTDAGVSISYQTKNDPFTTMLSKAADDTTLLRVPVKPETLPEPKKEVAVTVKQDRNTGIQQSPNANETAVAVTRVPAVATETTAAGNNTSVITKYAESSTGEGFGLVYFDSQAGIVDTIRLIIPNPAGFALIAETMAKKEDALPEMIKQSELPKNNKVTEPPVRSDPAKEVSAVTVAKKGTGCPAVANDDDFFRLRKNLANKSNASNEEAMVTEAKKYFKNKCFSTEQVKNLSTLFLTAEGKYGFFDAAYHHVTDRDKFASLSVELKEDYYLNRFKAMIQ